MKLKDLKEVVCNYLIIQVLNEGKTIYEVSPYSSAFEKYKNHHVCGITICHDNLKVAVISGKKEGK